MGLLRMWGELSCFLSSGDWYVRELLELQQDVKDLLESLQGSQSSSRVGARTCAFLPSCSSSGALPFAWIKGSVAFN